MKQNRGIIGIGLIVAIVLGAVIIGGGAYYLGNNNSKKEVSNPVVNTEVNLPDEDNNGLPDFATLPHEYGNESVVQNSKTDCVPNTTPSIKVLSPNGGETYTVGQKIAVEWENCNVSPSTYNIFVALHKDGGWDSVVYLSDATINDGNEIFTIPENVLAGSYKIRVGSVSAKVEQDYSDNSFTINSSKNSVSAIDNNLIKLTSCGVSVSKTSNWSVMSSTTNEIILDIPSADQTGGNGINIKCVLGNSITDTDAKFGNITYYYDSSTQKWMVNKPDETNGGTMMAVEATPLFNVNGWPVFRGTRRWLSYIVPISPSSILYLREGDTEGGYTQTLTNLVKTLKRL